MYNNFPISGIKVNFDTEYFKQLPKSGELSPHVPAGCRTMKINYVKGYPPRVHQRVQEDTIFVFLFQQY